MDIEDRQAIKMLIRLRDDYQNMRKAIDNRIGRKADGSDQNIPDRPLRPQDLHIFTRVADNARVQEKLLEQEFESILRRFPIYTEHLVKIKGLGPVTAAWIIGEFDIEKATTVSKMWQFAGLNPSLVRGKKRVMREDGSLTVQLTDTLIAGDKFTSGFVAPFNQRLRTALVGIMADNFIKQQNSYAIAVYYPYKARLEQESHYIWGVTDYRGSPIYAETDQIWKEVSKGHRDRAAKRYMVKMFLKDLYMTWRVLEGLPVRLSYQEEYLGHIDRDTQAGQASHY